MEKSGDVRFIKKKWVIDFINKDFNKQSEAVVWEYLGIEQVGVEDGYIPGQ